MARREEATDKLLSITHREVSEAEAPELMKTVREIAAKVGVEPPSVHFQKPGALIDKPIKKTLDYLIGVTTHSKGNGLLIGDKVLEIFGAANPKAPITEEFTAALAHELGHIKCGDIGTFGSASLAEHSPMIGMAAAIGATALISHYYTKKHGQPDTGPAAGEAAGGKSPEENLLGDTLPGEKGYSHEQGAQDRKHTLGLVITTAKYLAASVVGLTAGGFVSKALHHRMEYRADKFSAEFMGSGKPLARALEMYRAAGAKEFTNTLAIMRKNGVSEEVIAKKQKLQKYFQELTHPPIEERVERLNSM